VCGDDISRYAGGEKVSLGECRNNRLKKMLGSPGEEDSEHEK